MIERWAVFDTETTGLVANGLTPLAKQPYITEFNGVIIEYDGTGWRQIEEIDFLAKPPIPITDEITRITGITQEMCDGAKPFSEHVAAVATYFEHATHRAGHNLNFDECMVDFEFERARAVSWRPAKQKRRCTVELTEHVFGRRASLTELHAHLFGTPFDGAHRAAVDVQATVKCIIELRVRGML